jgi:6-phosphofructokinase 1
MKKIGVFTSGGDAPGMNAAVRAVVRAGIASGVEVVGIMRGYKGMIESQFKTLLSHDVSNIIQRGGTILKTARSKEFMTYEGRKKAYENLKSVGIEGLVAVGGDGTFTGAMIFEQEFGMPITGAPGTIDNDIFGTSYTIGFDTAVNTALSLIDKIRDTADSHDRAFLIEVMGRHCGWIALETALAGGAELVLVPEVETDLEQIVSVLQKCMDKKKTSLIVIVAEGAAKAEELEKSIAQKLPALEIRASVLGHVQRGGVPTAFDRLLGSRLGAHALHALLAGKSGVMAGICKDSDVLVPFSDAVKKRHGISREMIALINELGN